MKCEAKRWNTLTKKNYVRGISQEKIQAGGFWRTCGDKAVYYCKDCQNPMCKACYTRSSHTCPQKWKIPEGILL